MEKRSAYTIHALLEELKEKVPHFEEGQVFETIKSIYPDSNISKKNKNISFQENEFTKPLALSHRDKNILLKENSPMVHFFRNFSRGDFLKVISVKNDTAKCINLTLTEKAKKIYYNDSETNYIGITFQDIATGNVRLTKRKIDKYLK